MIKETDASKNDERQVKNKLNLLTHKKKGKTRTMFNKDMKSWKLGAFFVISLMLVAGLFGDTAQAQTLTVTTSPTDVASQGILRSVTITYEADADINTENEIGFVLPTDWVAAYANDGNPTATTGSFGTISPAALNVMASTGTPVVIRRASSRADTLSSATTTTGASATRSKTSYIDVVYIPASGNITRGVTLSGTVTVTVPVETAAVPDISPAHGGMAEGDRVVVTYHNVRVAMLAEAATVNDMGEFEADVPITIGVTPVTTPPTINVRYRHPSAIIVTTAPSVLKPLAVAHVTVKYRVTEAVLGDNDVEIALPTGWGAAYRASSSTDDADPRGFGTVLLPKALTPTAGDPRSYAVLTTTLDLVTTAGVVGTPLDLVDGDLTLAAGVASIDSDATAPAESMQKNDVISITYYNVRVPQLDPFQLTANRDDVSYDLTVMDSIVNATTATTSYMPVAKVRPPKVSAVTVSPTSAAGGSKKNVTVIYTAKDMIYGGNTVSVELPTGWEPYYLPQDKSRTVNSFGSAALTTQPRSSSDRNSTSYVLLKSTVKSDTSATDPTTDVTPNLYFDLANARLEVTVPGMMVNGDKIEVIFYNVKVEELSDTDHKDAALVIEDSIVGSSYAKTIEVIPPKLGNVTVTHTPDAVTAEATIDLTVRYTATQVLADDSTYGRIRVELPAGWTHSEDDDEIFDRTTGRQF